ANHNAFLYHRQMPELAQRHHFHDRGDRVGLPAADDLAGHDCADRFIKDLGSAFAEHAHDVTLRQNAIDTALAHYEYRADFSLAQNLDRSRQLGVRLDALNLMAFCIENCTYRHCRLPEADRALQRRDLYSFESSINSFGCACFVAAR